MEEMMKEYFDWVKKNNRFPSQCSKDEKEKTLGQWRNEQREKKNESLLKFDNEVKFEPHRGSDYASYVKETM